MAPTPKPRGQTRRRNTSTWRELPASGRQAEPPDLPEGEWLNSTREWWERAWRSPMAVAWVDSDFDTLVRLARLLDQVTRDPDKPTLHAQITALEDRLGLSPGARRRLQWEIKQAEVVDMPARSERRARAVEAA